jgi:hypothetical protein
VSSQNWRNVVASFVGIATPTQLGPFEIPLEGLLVQQGSGAQLYILREPYLDVGALVADFSPLQEIGIQLATNGLFLPARFNRWWLLSGSAIAVPTILTAFWDINVPPTR